MSMGYSIHFQTIFLREQNGKTMINPTIWLKQITTKEVRVEHFQKPLQGKLS